MAQATGLQDFVTARRIAHTLKSVAGNIGATRLEFAASVLEACLQSPASQAAIEASLADVRKLLAALTAVLEQALDNPAAQALASTNLTPDGFANSSLPPDNSGSAESGDALAVCLQLKSLLSAMDFAAEQCFTRHQSLLRSVLGPDFETLKIAMAAFDFEKAGQILDRSYLHPF